MSPSAPRVGVDLRALVAEPTGIGTFTLNTLRELSALDRMQWVGMAHAPTQVDEELRELGIELEFETAPLGVLWQQLRLPRRLRRGDLDLFWSPLLTLPRKPAIPSVVNVHDLTPLLYPASHSLKVRLSMLPFLRSSLRDAARVVTGSVASADDLRRHFPLAASKIEVVPNGVETAFRPGSPEQIAAVRNELGCPDGFVLFVGTIEPRKDVATLLDAWQLLPTPRLPLVLIGPYGWRNRSLLRRLERLRDQGVHYLGRVPRARLISTLQAATVFAYPSLYEGFGLPVLEAMACEIPTIACDTSSLPEVVGDAGLLVEPGSPNELAGSIGQLLDDAGLAAELAARGLARSREFRWSETAGRLSEIFHQVLEGG